MLNQSLSKRTLADIASYTSDRNYTRYSEIGEINKEFFCKEFLEEILDSIFPQCEFQSSDSICSERFDRKKPDGTVDETDRRLRRWYQTLLERYELQERIAKKTGKRPDEILFNREIVLDERDKMMIQRLIDYAQRTEPTLMLTKTVAKLKSYLDYEKCAEINELQATVPKPEQVPEEANFEIYGVPKIIKTEMLGDTDHHEGKGLCSWLKSEELYKQVDNLEKDIKRVVEFVPTCDDLIVTNFDFKTVKKKDRNSPQLLDILELRTISDETRCTPDFSEEAESLDSISLEEAPFIAPLVGIKINGEIYLPEDEMDPRKHMLEIFCECDPFMVQTQRLFKLENIGRKILWLKWLELPYYGIKHTLNESLNSDIFFDTNKFVLMPGQCRSLMFMFRPQAVKVIKARWELHIYPQIFCVRHQSFKVFMTCICKVPDELQHQVEKNIQTALDKSNEAAMDQLSKMHGEIVPIIPSLEDICPYTHPLDDREKFNAQNLGYNCERYEDVAMLSTFYDSLKKPRERSWDLQISSLKKFILRQTDPALREQDLLELNSLLLPMRGPLEVLEFSDHEQQQRACFIYVRGIINSTIDEWESLAYGVEMQFYKPELSRYLEELFAAEEEEATEDSKMSSQEPKTGALTEIPSFLDEELIKEIVRKRIFSSKYFRDSLYLLTYTKLCDVAENIVSILESTEKY